MDTPLDSTAGAVIEHADAYGGTLEDALDTAFQGLSRAEEDALLRDLWRRAEPGSPLGEAFLVFMQTAVRVYTRDLARAAAAEMTPAAAERVFAWAGGAAVPPTSGGPA